MERRTVVATIVVFSSLLFAIRTIYVLVTIWLHRTNGIDVLAASNANARRQKHHDPTAVCLVVLGSGGHTTEILALTKNMDRRRYHFEFCKASTDTTSVMRLPSLGVTTATVHNIPRAREVGQSYISSAFTTLYALVYSFALVSRVRPDVILTNGPGTALPLCMAVFVGRIFCACRGRVIFVESFCRVETLSLTGKLLYMWADVFVVHWPELHQRFPRSRRISSLVGA